MGPSEKYLYRSLKIIWLVAIVVVCEVFVPFGIFILPIFLLHVVVRLVAPYVDAKYGRPLTGMSSVTASDDIYGKPLYSVLLYYFVDGLVDIEEHRKLFLSRILKARRRDGKLKYPELRMHITTLCGFSIWKEDDDFDIDHYVKLHDTGIFNLSNNGAKLDEDALVAAANDILTRPFETGRSPWEVMVFHGAAAKSCDSQHQSLIVFRYHHALSDGYSITKLMENITTGHYFPSPKRQQPLWERVLDVALFPFTGMFVIVAYLQHYVDSNSWRFRVDFTKEKRRDMVYVCSEGIEVARIKQVKNKLGGSFNGVVLAAIAGGIRRYFVDNGAELPQTMHIGLSFPVPGHPDERLVNHWTAAIFKLPLGISSPIKRLEFIQRQFRNFETMIVSKMPYLGSLYGGLMFKDLVGFILNNFLCGTTCSMSIFPGPENIRFMSGEKITSGGFLLGPLSNQGVSLTVVSYNGDLRIFLGADRSIMEPEDTKKTVEYITDELRNYISK